MKIKHRYFPYPVLSPFSDDIKGSLTANLEAKVIDENIQFTVEFHLENSTLEEMIIQGKAVYGVHLECSSTMKRFFEKSTIPIFNFNINQKLLSNVVEINFFVIAMEELKNYTNKDFHEDFLGVPFSVQKGDQLAFTETIKMNITKEPIVQTNSIFELARNPMKDAPLIATDFQEKIIISIPRHAYDEVMNLRGYIGADVDQILVSMYYVPALIEALYYIKDLLDGDELYEIESSVWYRSISRRLQRLGRNIESLRLEENIPNVAMQVLDNINERVFTSIERIFGVEEGETIDG